jgi:hypothetical protein
MLSHTVPRKLLEQFAYDDPVTRSKRLWRYQKGRAPWPKASPKSATRWDRHFADPANAGKETSKPSQVSTVLGLALSQHLLKLDRQREHLADSRGASRRWCA